MGWTAFLVLMAWVPLVITIHEAGHAAVARLAGFRVTSFGVGRGRPILHHRGRSGTVFYLGRWFWAGGACVAVSRSPSASPREAIYHAGGVAAQGLLALLFAWAPPVWWLAPVAHFNLLVMAWNAIPWRIGGAQSDGWRFVAALSRGRLLTAPIFASRAALGRLLAFERTVESPVGVWYCRLLLAWSDLMVGRLPTEFLSEEADPVSVLDPALDALQQHVVASGLLAQGRPIEALRHLADVRAAHGSSLPMSSSDLLTLAEARAQLQAGNRAAAQAALARLAGVSGRFGDEARAISLEVALSTEDTAAARRAAERLSVRGVLDPPSAARALWRAGVLLGDDDLCARAQAEAARLLMLAGTDDEAPLARRLGGAAGWLGELHAPASGLRSD